MPNSDALFIQSLSARRSYSSKKNNSREPHSNASDESAQRDRARIIHSAAFRRLQSKTQILGIGGNDFYRTRLTHSLEVAQIGSGICELLRYTETTDKKTLQWIASLSQMEAICLAHDIGHPPFGHGGEIALNFFMHKYGGFEGNGQTLRIAAKLGEYSDNFGLNLTRRTMLGLLKYPVPHHDVAPNYDQRIKAKNQSSIRCYQPPKCIHDDEANILQWILEPLPQADQDEFQKTTNEKSTYQSFDTSIMELADDIAYGVHDLEDALALKLVSERQWQEEVQPKIQGGAKTLLSNANIQKLFSDSNQDRKFIISKLVSYFIKAISITKHSIFQTPLLDLQVVMLKEAEDNLEVLKAFVFKYVIKTQEVKMLEYKGQQIIIKLFQTLLDNPDRLLPPSTSNKINTADEQNNYRVICDYIAGMTDNYATKVHNKLF